MSKQVGYVRVSTLIQNTSRQLDSVKLDKVFEDKTSAKTADRPQLRACMEYLREDDCLHVHSIDRLARNLFDLEKIVKELTSRDVEVYFHKENLIFSGNKNPMSTLMLQMIGAVAQFERSLINERRREGVEMARRRNIRFGRPPKLSQQQLIEVSEKAQKGHNKTNLAKEYGISRSALYVILKQNQH